ncbi:MAG: Na(+)/H(+) antiporter subunit B [Candidatus Puniceispirillales bacterium]
MKTNPILRVISKTLFAPIILYGLYVQFHGDFGPGGGFQAGVIIAAAFILYGMVFSLEELKQLAPPKIVHILMAMGALIYTGVGVVTFLLGAEFLNYDVLAKYPAKGQHYGILIVEFGVGLTVASTILGLFMAFAGFDIPRKTQKKGDSHKIKTPKKKTGVS